MRNHLTGDQAIALLAGAWPSVRRYFDDWNFRTIGASREAQSPKFRCRFPLEFNLQLALPWSCLEPDLGDPGLLTPSSDLTAPLYEEFLALLTPLL